MDGVNESVSSDETAATGERLVIRVLLEVIGRLSDEVIRLDGELAAERARGRAAHDFLTPYTPASTEIYGGFTPFPDETFASWAHRFNGPGAAVDPAATIFSSTPGGDEAAGQPTPARPGFYTEHHAEAARRCTDDGLTISGPGETAV